MFETSVRITHHRILVDEETCLHACLLQPSRNYRSRPIIIFSHGFLAQGPESDRVFLKIAKDFSSRGYTAIIFDYRGSGYSDLNFEEMTFDTELADLHAVIDFAHKVFPDPRICLWGTSLGSAVASHVASKRTDVSYLVLWSLSAELQQRYKKRLGSEIHKKGFVYDKGFKVSLDFLDSLKNRDTYKAIKEAGIPVLLVHGDEDPTAPIELSRTAHRVATGTSTLHEIKGGKHFFHSHHLTEALRVTQDWLLKNDG